MTEYLDGNQSGQKQGLWLCTRQGPGLTDGEIGDVMLDWLQFGDKAPEGVLAILCRALCAMAEVRERLKQNEVYFSHKNTICAPAKIAFECGVKVYSHKPEEGSDHA